MADAVDLADVADYADFRVHKDIEYQPQPGGVVRGIDVSVQPAWQAVVMQDGVAAYSLEHALGQHGLVGHVEQLVLDGTAAAVYDEDLHHNHKTFFCNRLSLPTGFRDACMAPGFRPKKSTVGRQWAHVNMSLAGSPSCERPCFLAGLHAARCLVQ